MRKIDNSQLSCFIQCPRRYYNRYIKCLKKTRLDESVVHKLWGGSIHLALEQHYLGKSDEDSKRAFLNNFTPIEGDETRTPMNGLVMLQEYFNYYQTSLGDLSDKNFTILGVELNDSYIIRDTVEWQVKIDLLIKNKSGNWVMDHKITKKPLPSFIGTFTPNMQVSGYVNYARKKFNQCSGFIPNVLHYGFRKKAYKGEIAGFYWKPERDIVNRNKEQLDDFEDNVISAVKMLDMCEKENKWHKNETLCTFCEYKELCTSVDDVGVLQVMYEKCNPFEYLK